jgi:hypothetical protein
MLLKNERLPKNIPIQPQNSTTIFLEVKQYLPNPNLKKDALSEHSTVGDEAEIRHLLLEARSAPNLDGRKPTD